MEKRFLETDKGREFILSIDEEGIETLNLEESRIYQVYRSANGQADGKQEYENPVCMRTYNSGHLKFELFKRMVEGK